MKTNILYLSCLFVLALCCSMDRCKTNVLPETKVHGTVIEYSSGKPVKGFKLIVYGNGSGGSWTNAVPYHFYDSIRTDANGSYKYTFTPVDNDNDVNISTATGLFDNFALNHSSNQKLTYGKDNVADVVVQRLINVIIHLINNSLQNRDRGEISFKGCCFDPGYTYGARDIGASKLDTLMYFTLPARSDITTTFDYYNRASKITSLISFNRSFRLGSNDTTITIINP